MSLLNKVKHLAQSPEGKKLFAEAQKMAKDPATKQKIDEARRRLGGTGKPKGA